LTEYRESELEISSEGVFIRSPSLDTIKITSKHQIETKLKQTTDAMRSEVL